MDIFLKATGYAILSLASYFSSLDIFSAGSIKFCDDFLYHNYNNYRIVQVAVD